MQTQGSPLLVCIFVLSNDMVTPLTLYTIKGRGAGLVTNERWDAYLSAARELDRARYILQNLVLSPHVRMAYWTHFFLSLPFC